MLVVLFVELYLVSFSKSISHTPVAQVLYLSIWKPFLETHIGHRAIEDIIRRYHLYYFRVCLFFG